MASRLVVSVALLGSSRNSCAADAGGRRNEPSLEARNCLGVVDDEVVDVVVVYYVRDVLRLLLLLLLHWSRLLVTSLGLARCAAFCLVPLIAAIVLLDRLLYEVVAPLNQSLLFLASSWANLLFVLGPKVARARLLLLLVRLGALVLLREGDQAVVRELLGVGWVLIVRRLRYCFLLIRFGDTLAGS